MVKFITVLCGRLLKNWYDYKSAIAKIDRWVLSLGKGNVKIFDSFISA